MLDYELKRFDKGVLFCYFGMVDIIQHMFWRYIDKKHPLYYENAPQEYKEMIYTWYKKLDAVLGDVLSKIGENDSVIVLSDHGFNTFRKVVHINSWLRNNGYLASNASSQNTKAGFFSYVDWHKTKAFALGFGGIYINVQGKERFGIVNARQVESLKTEIANKLKGWRDDKTGELIVRNVYRNEDIMKGRYAKDAPDLLIGFNAGYRVSWQTALGEAPSESVIEDNIREWSGDHLFDPELMPGIFLSNKPLKNTPASITEANNLIFELLNIDKGQET